MKKQHQECLFAQEVVAILKKSRLQKIMANQD
jgi:hypothetical protein